jgi:hypothetical protein
LVRPNNLLQILILSNAKASTLEKTIEYWKNSPFKVTILHEIFDDRCRFQNNVNSNLEYIVSSNNLVNRYFEIATFVTEKYVVMVPDDEILVMDTLHKAIKLLEGDDELASIGGQTITVQKYGFAFLAGLTYKGYFKYENSDRDIMVRFEYHYNPEKNHRIGSCYRVIRAHVFLDLLQILEKSDLNECIYLLEVLSDVVLLRSGNSFYMDDVIWIRNWIAPSRTGEIFNRNMYFYKWLESDTLNREKFINLLRMMLPDVSLPDLQYIMELILNSRKKMENREEVRTKSSQSKYLLLRVIYRHIKSIWLIVRNNSKIILTDELNSFLTITHNKNTLKLLRFFTCSKKFNNLT